jgi:D-sedoheptulose 7-phosphate isomerase
MKELIAQQIQLSSNTIHSILLDEDILTNIENIVNASTKSLRSGGKILFAGNGGSAADAQHMAGEFVSRFIFDRPALAAIALTVDTSILTAIGNDYGYESVFSRQILALGKKGDIFVAYSTSGKSKNIIKALKEAKNLGLITVTMTGNKQGEICELSDYVIKIPSDSTPKIQEGHLVVGHIICGLIESAIFKAPD